MWFLFGLITALGFVAGSLLWRQKVSWKGEVIKTDDIEFELNIIRNDYFPDQLYIGIKGIDDVRFRFKAETWCDKLFKYFGVSREYQTNQAEFDDRVYIASDNANIHFLISSNPDLAASILEIFNHPVTPGIKVKDIRNYAGKIWIEYDFPRELSDAGILLFAEKPVKNLMSIVKNYNDLAAQSIVPSRDPFGLKAIVLLAISSGLAINGLAQVYRTSLVKIPFTVDGDAVLRDAFWIGSGVVIALVVIAIYLLKRSSRTHLVILELLVIGMFGAVSTAYINLRDANMDFDDSRPELFETKVLDKKFRIRRKGRTTYTVVTKNWNEGKGRKSLSVSSNFYSRVRVGDWLVIKQRVGYLNYRWVEDLEKKRR